ncbi:hypothetical protein NQZ68_039287 [Dissostichus eleginoides]|nr:hypothetical protein NQZ68_039287 [Dissostichus eleginoides]
MGLADAEPVKAAIRLQGERLHQHEEKFSVIHQAVRDLAEQQHGLQASVNTQISDMAEAVRRLLARLDAGATAPALPDAAAHPQQLAAPPTTAAPLPGSHAVPLPRLAPPDKKKEDCHFVQRNQGVLTCFSSCPEDIIRLVTCIRGHSAPH